MKVEFYAFEVTSTGYACDPSIHRLEHRAIQAAKRIARRGATARVTRDRPPFDFSNGWEVWDSRNAHTN